MAVQSFAGFLFPGLNDRFSLYQELHDEFVGLDEVGSSIKEDTIKALKINDDVLAQYDIKIKISNLKSVVLRIESILKKLDEFWENKGPKQESCCGCRKDKVLNKVCYGIALLGPVINFADTVIGSDATAGQWPAIKYFKQYSVVVALPLIRGIDVCKKKEAELRSNTKTFSLEVKASLNNISSIQEYLVHKLEMLEPQGSIGKGEAKLGEGKSGVDSDHAAKKAVEKFMQRGLIAKQKRQSSDEDPVKQKQLQQALET